VCTRSFENCVAQAHAVLETLKARSDIRPDLVVAHSGFGSSLFLPHLYDAPIVNFFEYFYRPTRPTVSYRPELGTREQDLLRCRTASAMLLLDLDNCDRGWCPNFAQRDAFPREYHPKLEVIPEGVDAALYRRRQVSERRLPDGTAVPPGTRVVTYVSRGFELMRGFDIFMRAAKRIAEQCPDVLFVVVGTDRAYYGGDRRVTGDKSLRERVLGDGNYDLSRFHFTGWVSEETLIDVLSISDLHIYLTVPFITSWSMLDAMSCSCVVLASDQPCTREYITHERNGLLCDFFDAEGIANRAVEVLRDPAGYRLLGTAARQTIEEKYSLDVCFPRLKALFEQVAAAGPRRPSVRAELLVRPAKPAPWAGTAPVPTHHSSHEPLSAFDGTIPFFADACPARPVVRAGMTKDGRGVNAAGGKTVMFCWELGAGLGHLMQMLPLAEDLAKQGYRVFVVLRELERAVEVFGRAGVSYLSAPYVPTRTPRCGRAVGFAQLLANTEFGEDNELFARASAWRNLIRFVRPDLIVFDHAPTALLAARAFPGVVRAVIGSGFCAPPPAPVTVASDPNAPPWGLLRPAAAAADPAPARAVEAEVWERVNWVLANWRLPPLEHLAQLYTDVAETFLVTFPELDHFRERTRAAYWGPVLHAPAGTDGEAPRWPEGAGKRVFAYLKATPSTREVLQALKAAGCPTLAYVDGLGGEARKRIESSTLRLADRRVDVARASRECHLAVLNGGHAVTSEMLLAGKPVLAVPLAFEQQLTGEVLRRLGAGESAPPRRGEPWDWSGRPKLDALLTDERYTVAARRFGQRYASFDRHRQRRALNDRVCELLSVARCPKDHPEAALAKC
jgi:glycosyltransferase involved in cell wall biosynthesis/UDP:flavonoid glycosyltransferase YjiC (YdhE family)